MYTQFQYLFFQVEVMGCLDISHQYCFEDFIFPVYDGTSGLLASLSMVAYISWTGSLVENYILAIIVSTNSYSVPTINAWKS